MKSDEGFLDMSDKTILIDCLNENVIHQQNLRFKNPRNLLGFFFTRLANYMIFSL